jgi:hypothetical protein
LVPETLLKKRKSQEKERADKAQQRESKKKVCFHVAIRLSLGDDTYPTRLALSNAVVTFNHLSGLNDTRFLSLRVMRYLIRTLTSMAGVKEEA